MHASQRGGCMVFPVSVIVASPPTFRTPSLRARQPGIKERTHPMSANTPARKKLTRQDLAEAAETYKNWGKWGPDDEIGTLNYTSPEDIVAAARLVKKGKVISLALNYDEKGPQGAKSNYPALGRINPLHVMLRTGTDAYSGVLDKRGIRASDDMVIMQEEIFGPLLPVKTYRTLDEVIAYVNAKDRPLGFYVFTNDEATEEKLLYSTISGGVTVNNCMLLYGHDAPPARASDQVQTLGLSSANQLFESAERELAPLGERSHRV